MPNELDNRRGGIVGTNPASESKERVKHAYLGTSPAKSPKRKRAMVIAMELCAGRSHVACLLDWRSEGFRAGEESLCGGRQGGEVG